MKKIIRIIICTFLIMALSACGTQEKVDLTDEVSGGDVVSEPNPPSLGDRVNKDDADQQKEEKESEQEVVSKGTAFEVKRNGLEIFSAPAFSGEIIGRMESAGIVLILEERKATLHNGKETVWGRLEKGAGWINLIDAEDTRDMPLLCLDCHASMQEDIYISRYSYCTECHNAQNLKLNGACEICGRGVETEATLRFDGKRCLLCCKCDVCGGSCADTFGTVREYLCEKCSKDETGAYCEECGLNLATAGSLCEDCYIEENYDVCGGCGEKTAHKGFAFCEQCEEFFCHICMNPMTEGHNCDDYPNVFCPNCDWSMFTTGVGCEGITCPECGTKCL